jgi:hypothetical protein
MANMRRKSSSDLLDLAKNHAFHDTSFSKFKEQMQMKAKQGAVAAPVSPELSESRHMPEAVQQRRHSGGMAAVEGAFEYGKMASPSPEASASPSNRASKLLARRHSWSDADEKDESNVKPEDIRAQMRAQLMRKSSKEVVTSQQEGKSPRNRLSDGQLPLPGAARYDSHVGKYSSHYSSESSGTFDPVSHYASLPVKAGRFARAVTDEVPVIDSKESRDNSSSLAEEVGRLQQNYRRHSKGAADIQVSNGAPDASIPSASSGPARVRH